MASRAVAMAVMTEARTVDVEQEGHTLHSTPISWVVSGVVVSDGEGAVVSGGGGVVVSDGEGAVVSGGGGVVVSGGGGVMASGVGGVEMMVSGRQAEPSP